MKNPKIPKTAKTAKTPNTRIELEAEIVADLEASDTDRDSIRGGANYSRAISGTR